MALTDNLQADYELDEASGDAIDSHNSNDLTDNNTVGATTGLISGARTFNGSNEYFSGSLLSGSKTNLSLEAWVYRASSGDVITVGWGGTNNNRFNILWFSDNRLYFQVENGAINYRYITSTDTGWHHIVLTYDGSQGTASNRVKAYYDGSLQSLTGGTSTPSSYTITGNFEIGRESANSRYTLGYHDVTRVWDRTLSGTEVTELYNSGAGLDYAGLGGGGTTYSQLWWNMAYDYQGSWI